MAREKEVTHKGCKDGRGRCDYEESVPFRRSIVHVYRCFDCGTQVFVTEERRGNHAA